MSQTTVKGKQNSVWLGRKGVPLRIVQEIQFDHTTKRYMHKPDTVLENETHKILWDFEIKTHHLIPVRRPHLVLINKRRVHLQSFKFYRYSEMKKKRNRKEIQILRPYQRTKNSVKHESDGDTNFS